MHSRRLRVTAGEAPYQPAGDRGREQRVPVLDHAYGRDQVFRRHVLEQEAARPGGERGVDVLIQVERGEDDDPGRRDGPGEDAAGGLETVELDVYGPVLLAAPALGGPLTAVIGALLPAGWAARTRTATALRSE